MDAFYASSNSASRLAVVGQADREFGELAEPAIDLDRAAVLLGDDVMGDRQTEPGAFAGGFCIWRAANLLIRKHGANADLMLQPRR